MQFLLIEFQNLLNWSFCLDKNIFKLYRKFYGAFGKGLFVIVKMQGIIANEACESFMQSKIRVFV